MLPEVDEKSHFINREKSLCGLWKKLLPIFLSKILDFPTEPAIMKAGM